MRHAPIGRAPVSLRDVSHVQLPQCSYGIHLRPCHSVEKGMPPSRINDTTYGRKQPGWVYTTADLPALPASTPGWLVEVLQGLVKSDHCEAERRLSPREAISMLEVEVRVGKVAVAIHLNRTKTMGRTEYSVTG